MGDRTSWLSKEAKVNGLFAVPRRRRSKILPQSHAAKEGEVEAMKNVLREEAKVKDKLMESLSKRCSEAEAKVDELLLEKARVERELASLKYELDNRVSVEKELEEKTQEVAQVRCDAENSKRREAELEIQLQELSRHLHEARASLTEQIHERERGLQELRHALQLKAQEFQQLEQRYMADTSAWQAKSEQLTQVAENQTELTSENATLQEENRVLLNKMQAMLEENKQLRKMNAHMSSRLEQDEVNLQSTKRKTETHVERIKEQEKLLKEAVANQQEAEAKAARLADQLKSSNKKAAFLAKKSDAMQKKLQDKDQEVKSLHDKLEDTAKKYRLVKERLDYVKNSLAQQGCTTPGLFGSNNNEEDPSGNAPQVIPTLHRRTAQPVLTRKSSRCVPRSDRCEDQPATHSNQPSAARHPLPDPALDPESDAPEWMKF